MQTPVLMLEWEIRMICIYFTCWRGNMLLKYTKLQVITARKRNLALGNVFTPVILLPYYGMHSCSSNDFIYHIDHGKCHGNSVIVWYSLMTISLPGIKDLKWQARTIMNSWKSERTCDFLNVLLYKVSSFKFLPMISAINNRYSLKHEA